jgi:streptogramin lyase
LNRFDGYRFTVYRTDPDDPNSLSDNAVTDLYEDSEGRLWVATRGAGVNRFDPQTETFTRYRHEPGSSANSLASDTIRSIFEDSRGHLWFGGLPTEGQAQLTRFDPVTETFTPYLMEHVHPEVTQRNAVWNMILDFEQVIG